MPEIRTDPLGGTRVIIADDRAGRPGAFNVKSQPPPIDPATDPFSEGNESMTPPELWADRPAGAPPDSPGWSVRAVPNLYPALRPDAAAPDSEPDADLYTVRSATGSHEVIVNSPKPVQSLSDLTLEELTSTVSGWQVRVRAHSESPCRHLFVNEGREAGASLPHTHSQLIGVPFVPAMVAREREAFTAHAARTAGSNLLNDILGHEVRRRDRIVAIDENSVLLAPWASASAYQLMLIPRAGGPLFEAAQSQCVEMLWRALALLRQRFEGPPPLNLWVRTAPSGAEHWTWRIDIHPRLAQPAGIELGTGLEVNPVAPERAAAELRELDSQT